LREERVEVVREEEASDSPRHDEAGL